MNQLLEAVLRIATPEDHSAVDALMKESCAAIFPHFYDERQTESAVRYVAQVDPMLLADGTFFALEGGGELVGCGGWSRRHRLYSGSGESGEDARLLDPATEAAKGAGDVRTRRLDTARAWPAHPRRVRGGGTA